MVKTTVSPEVLRILAPFLEAKDDVELMAAQGKLRRAIRRGEDGITEGLVREAARAGGERLAPVIEKSLEGTRAPHLGPATVYSHRADLAAAIGNRRGERHLMHLQTAILIDILDVLTDDRP